METGGISKDCAVLSLGALVLHPRTLDPIKNGEVLEEFYSLSKPPKEDIGRIQEQTLKVNKITMEEVEAAPAEEQVWKTFVNFVKKFANGNTQWDYPVLAGYNIINFNKPILDRLCARYGNVNKEGRSNLFHMTDIYDVMNQFKWWFESNQDVKSYSLDNMRTYLGMPKDKDALVGEVIDAHHTVRDIRDTAAILKKFILLKRNLQKNYNIKFNGAFCDK